MKMSTAPTPLAQISTQFSHPSTGTATPAHPLRPIAAAGLPPPSTFDILPDLHTLLKRLLDGPSQTSGVTPNPSATQQLPASSAAIHAPPDGPLEIQNIAAAANDIRLKIQRARRAVLGLPEIDRTIEDQKEEIEDLLERRQRLREMLSVLGKARDEDENMTG